MLWWVQLVQWTFGCGNVAADASIPMLRSVDGGPTRESVERCVRAKVIDVEGHALPIALPSVVADFSKM
eukprot:2230890-Amphidinium_carterae.1